MDNRGIIFTARGEVGFEDLDAAPQPGSDEVLLETIYSGVTNGTERHALLEDYRKVEFPTRQGYQQVGRVAACGEEVSRFEVGDHAFLGTHAGHRSWNLVSENDLVIKLPPDMDFKYCALLGVAGVAMRAVRRMGVGEDDRVWIAGQGPIGHFIAQAARALGAHTTVSDVIDSRLDAARKCGAETVIDALKESALDRVAETAPFQFIYDCCGAERLLFDVHERSLLAQDGVVGMMAMRDTVAYPWWLLLFIEARLETSCHFQLDDLAVLLNFIRQGTIHLVPVVSDIVPIDEAPNMYRRLADGDEALHGVIFDWTENAA